MPRQQAIVKRDTEPRRRRRWKPVWAIACLLCPSSLMATPSPESGAGDYVGGGVIDGVTRLQLLADHRFVYSVRGLDSNAANKQISDGGKRIDHGKPITHIPEPPTSNHRHSGTWRREGSAIVLTPTYDEGREDFPDLPVRWLVIRWGSRPYLVPEGKLINFCNAYNLGTEPRDGPTGDPFLLLRVGMWTHPANGLPDLPDVWRAHLLDKPIHGTLTRVDEAGFGYLDVGGDHGLQSGMQLVAYDADCRSNDAPTCLRPYRLKVVCPCDDSARVEFVYSPGTDPVPPFDAVGDTVSTSLGRTSDAATDSTVTITQP